MKAAEPNPSLALPEREENGRPDLTWRDAARFLKTYWPVIAGLFVSTVVATYVVVSLLSDQYDVGAKLLVRLGREQLELPPTVRSGGNLFSSGLRKEDVASEIQMLQSPDLMAEVVDSVGPEHFKPRRVPPEGLVATVKFHLKELVRGLKELLGELQIALGLKKRLTDREAAIHWLLGNVSFAAERESDVIAVQLRSPDPAGGVRLLEQWIDLYLRRRLEVRQSTGVKEFFAAEVDRARSRLAQAEREKLAWKQNGALGEGKEQLALLLRQLHEIAAEQRVTSREEEALQRELAATKSQIARTRRSLPVRREETPNPVLRKLKDELTNLQMERSRLLTKFDSRSVAVLDAEEQIARVTQLLQKEAATQVLATYEANPLMTSLEQKLQERSIQLEGLKAKSREYQRQKERLEAELRAATVADTRLTELERERQIAEQEYLAIIKRKQEADAAVALDLQRISNVSVLVPPVASLEPAAPRRLMLLGLSALLGLSFGLGLSFVLAYLDDRVADPAHLARATGLPYLGAVRR